MTWTQPDPPTWPIKPDPLPPSLPEPWYEGPALWVWSAIAVVAILFAIAETSPTGRLLDRAPRRM